MTAVSDFVVLPAIDLRGGKVVRLAQGDPARQTVYATDPGEVAARWVAEGARWLHVVNLDGAFGETGAANAQALPAILAAGAAVELGGGLRQPDDVARALEAGVARVVLGTAAVEDPDLVDWAVTTYGPGRIVAGIDAREGRVQVRGWAEGTTLTVSELGTRLAGQGLTLCVFTDVARDGIGAGVNVEASAALAAATGLGVIASGGVATAADVAAVKAARLVGVIVGRALYAGHVRLSELLGAGAES